MLFISVLSLMLSHPFIQESNSQMQWKAVTDSTFHMGFDCPSNASVELQRPRYGVTSLRLRVFCPDTLRPSFGNLLGDKTILLADFDSTRHNFSDAAVDWGLEYHEKHWYIYADPASGPSNRLTLVESKNWIALKGRQSFGQNSSEGYAELASVPYAFVFVKGKTQPNVTAEVWYDSTASAIFDRIIQSIHIIEK